MDTRKYNFELKKEEIRLEEFIENENNCPLCGTTLELAHSVDYLTLSVKEEAHCPACRLRTRVKDHFLQ